MYLAITHLTRWLYECGMDGWLCGMDIYELGCKYIRIHVGIFFNDTIAWVQCDTSLLHWIAVIIQRITFKS